MRMGSISHQCWWRVVRVAPIDGFPLHEEIYGSSRKKRAKERPGRHRDEVGEIRGRQTEAKGREGRRREKRREWGGKGREGERRESMRMEHEQGKESGCFDQITGSSGRTHDLVGKRRIRAGCRTRSRRA